MRSEQPTSSNENKWDKPDVKDDEEFPSQPMVWGAGNNLNQIK